MHFFDVCIVNIIRDRKAANSLFVRAKAPYVCFLRLRKMIVKNQVVHILLAGPARPASAAITPDISCLCNPGS